MTDPITTKAQLLHTAAADDSTVFPATSTDVLKTAEELKSVVKSECRDVDPLIPSTYGVDCLQRLKDSGQTNSLFKSNKPVTVAASDGSGVVVTSVPNGSVLGKVSAAATLNDIEGAVVGAVVDGNVANAVVEKVKSICSGKTVEECDKTTGALPGIRTALGKHPAQLAALNAIGTNAGATAPGGQVIPATGSDLGLAGDTPAITYPTAQCGVAGFAAPISATSKQALITKCSDDDIYAKNTEKCAPCVANPANPLGLDDDSSTFAASMLKRGYTLSPRLLISIPTGGYTLNSDAPAGAIASVPGGYSANATDANNQPGWGAAIGFEFAVQGYVAALGDATALSLGGVVSIAGARMAPRLTEDNDVKAANAGSGLQFASFSMIDAHIMPQVGLEWRYGFFRVGYELGVTALFAFEGDENGVLESPRDGGVGSNYDGAAGFTHGPCGELGVRFGGKSAAFTMGARACYAMSVVGGNRVTKESTEGGVNRKRFGEAADVKVQTFIGLEF